MIDGRVRVAAEDYLDHCGNAFTSRIAPAAFARLSESIDLQALEPETVHCATTVVAVAQDRLVPLEDSRVLASRLGGTSQLHVLDSVFGHDAFLKEEAAIARILTLALDTAPARHSACTETLA